MTPLYRGKQARFLIGASNILRRDGGQVSSHTILPNSRN